MSACFAVGDIVQPKQEWLGSANNIPTGQVRRIAPWGKDGALYVGDERRAFAAFVFEHCSRTKPPGGTVLASCGNAGASPCVSREGEDSNWLQLPLPGFDR